MFKRHSLVWLTDGGWQDVHVDEPHRHVVERWQTARWPLVARRRDAGAAAGEVCLGIAVAPDARGKKLRLPIRSSVSAIREVREPLDIADVIPHAGPTWHRALEHLRRDAKEEGIAVRVYGSLALQALTGQRYVRETSDIDLLLTPRDRYALERTLELLARHRHSLPLDGELEFPDGSGVSWKEWMQARGARGNRVLAKRAADVALLRIDDLLSSLGEYTCSA